MKKHQFLAMSIPHGVQVLVEGYGMELVVDVLGESIVTTEDDNSINTVLPILHPLSDLTKPITHKGETFVPIHRLLKNSCFDLSLMSEKEIFEYGDDYKTTELIHLYELLLYLEWHFDIANLIESGDAIDVNTLETNPYA